MLTQSALYGRLAGLVVTLGLCTGLLFHTAAGCHRRCRDLQTSALAFTILKFVGGRLPHLSRLAGVRAGAARIDATGNGEIGLLRLYGRGIIMNVTNPKVAIFFLAFLPQFADPARGSLAPQMFAFGGIFILATIIVFGSVAWGAGFLGEWLRRSPRAQSLLNRAAGIVFVGLAARLVMTER